ncbi:hypothetical protein I5L59_15010 [Pseudomonas moraviensis]|uniref:hypothetical protein n=1 Tax=Pseudomonas moraviensis TaxID=321662 RepID=UPI0018D6BAD8|nr:hypothetical protein [Pseudomonas moraviensis]MBH3444885.1 hypothetical protein [Pseudomonas moraviensis]
MTILLAADLFPPKIPMATDLETPEAYHGGISLEAVRTGYLTAVVDPWVNQSIGEKCAFHWDNSLLPVRTIEIDDTNLNKQLLFQIPAGQITNGDAYAFYKVTRPHQQPVKSQEILMLVKFTRPGGDDSDSEPGNSGLVYTLDPDPSKGVDAEMAKLGVKLLASYVNCATFDRIIGRWGDQLVSYYPVTREQVEDPVNNPIFLTFTEKVIRDEGNGRNIEVSYQVFDRVGNLPDPNAPWSKVTYVNVDLSISRLPAPTIWVNNQNVTTIDLKVLGTSDAAARVYFTAPDCQPGDKVVLTWAGTTSAGAPVIVGPLEKTVDSVPGHHDFPIPNSKITAIVNGSAKVDYQLLRANVPARPSNNVVVTITGEVSQLKPPMVVEAPDYKLDPNRHQNGFTVVFDTAAFGANHEVKLEIAGRPGAGSVPPQQKPVAGQSKVQFDIDFSVTGANLQRSVELIYSLIVNGQPTPAQSVTLVIGELLQSSMPMPKLEGFDGEVLDVGLIKDDTKVLCEAWPFQCAGCPIWLEYVETFAGGGERVKQQFVGAAHDQGVGLSYLAEVEWLRGCKAESRLTIVLAVGLFKNATLSVAEEMPGRFYKITEGLYDLTTFTDFLWNGWGMVVGYPGRITKLQSEFFFETVLNQNFHGVQLKKDFDDITLNATYRFSFDYQSIEPRTFRLTKAGTVFHDGYLGPTEGWQPYTFNFHSGPAETKTLTFIINPTPNSFAIDNICVRKI